MPTSDLGPPASDLRPSSSVWLHRYATLVAACTVVLIAAGASVTSTDSGLSVPDWPTTYGWNMFTFPLSRMVGGIRFEHTHRLIASTVGFMTIILAVWTWRVESRRWVRWLGVACLGAVVLQGVLGGITVLFFLPPAVSIGHAGLAQIFFCLTLTLALVTSQGWQSAPTAVDDQTLRRVATLTTVLIYTQILVGATMRHNAAGLAIPDFPWAFGHAIPPMWDARIAMNFVHRVGALVVTLGILATSSHVLYHHRGRRELMTPAVLLLVFVAIQVTVGAFVIWSRRDPVINSLHVVNGAAVLGTSLVLTLRSWRGSTVPEFKGSRVPVPGSSSSAGSPAEVRP
jgi:cytochrome c oxidase assembly protein subunit 15